MSNFRNEQSQNDWSPVTRHITDLDGMFVSDGMYMIEKVPGGPKCRFDKANSHFLIPEIKRGEGFRSADGLTEQEEGQLEAFWAFAHLPRVLVVLVHCDPNERMIAGAKRVIPVEYQVINPKADLKHCLPKSIRTNPEDFGMRIQRWKINPRDFWFTDPKMGGFYE